MIRKQTLGWRRGSKLVCSESVELFLMSRFSPWNALGQPEDIANAALFLCSDEA